MANVNPQMEEQFGKLSKNFFALAFQIIGSPKRPDKNKLLMMFLAFGFLILAYAGAEAIQIIFRSNFGKKGISILRAFLAALAFGVISSIAYGDYTSYDIATISVPASRESFFVTALIMGLFCLYILGRTVMNLAGGNKSVNESYRGDSWLLGFLERDGMPQSRVQNLAEPLTALAFGILTLSYNQLLGGAFIFCAISSWLHLAAEGFFSLTDARDTLANVHGISSAATAIVEDDSPVANLDRPPSSTKRTSKVEDVFALEEEDILEDPVKEEDVVETLILQLITLQRMKEKESEADRSQRDTEDNDVQEVIDMIKSVEGLQRTRASNESNNTGSSMPFFRDDESVTALDD